MNAQQLRLLATGLGLGSIAFGATPIIAPRFFGRLFGVDAAERPQVASVMRSVGARDVAIGYGLFSAANRGLPVAPWLLARLLCDGIDTIACAMAIRNGARSPRFLALTACAAGAAAGGALLYVRASSGECAGGPRR
jgi:hypothetical protein